MSSTQNRAKGLQELRNLLPGGQSTTHAIWSAERLKSVSALEVRVIATEHANLDSLPLRFNVHFLTDTVITLKRIQFEGVDADHAERFHVEAWTTFNGEEEQTGHFVLGQLPGFTDLVLITVWRHDADTEFGLSEVMKKLRRKGVLMPATLRRLHPLYRDGTLSTHADLVQYLARELSEREVAALREATDEALAKATAATSERDQAVEELRAERERFQREMASAQRDGKTASLSMPDTLVEVLEDQSIRGSSCTVLVMGDGSRRFMKTATFDADGRVTAKARSLVGRRVRTSCWDPFDQPGRWSREGYFRNVYAAE